MTDQGYIGLIEYFDKKFHELGGEISALRNDMVDKIFTYRII